MREDSSGIRLTATSHEASSEIVIVIDRPHDKAISPGDLEAALRNALRSMSLKDAAAMVAEATGLPRRDVYKVALALEGQG